MSFDRRSLRAQLNDLWEERGEVLELDLGNNKYVLISDMHMGDGKKSDDFRKNERATVRAFNHYHSNGYKLILLGDVEELWQFTPDEVANRYDDSVYTAIRQFGDDNVYRVFGNHDIDWKTTDPIRTTTNRGYKVYEGIKMAGSSGDARILLVHGHQGTKDSDKYSFVSRAAVMLYRYIEPFFKIDRNPAAPRSPIVGTFERDRYRWAKNKRVMLICGHTHRAVFSSKTKTDKNNERIRELRNELLSDATIGAERGRKLTEIESLKEDTFEEKAKNRDFDLGDRNPGPYYFNTGCALYTDGLTVLEIADDRIKLVKWHRNLGGGEPYAVYETETLSDLFARL
jgi:UDP-2,3-diacylglucosamine pyrophosphatase LpxH